MMKKKTKQEDEKYQETKRIDRDMIQFEKTKNLKGSKKNQIKAVIVSEACLLNTIPCLETR